ncbi:MAG TPA: hypothetical protein VEY13_10560 [Rubrobacteraceae bacterium]|nr:hypothetical protein [Rubrobacteraceae bacterium]
MEKEKGGKGLRRFGLMAAMIGSLLIFAVPASGATLGKKVFTAYTLDDIDGSTAKSIVSPAQFNAELEFQLLLKARVR